MAYFADSDITGMLEDWGNVIEVNGVEAPCALDEEELPELEANGGGGQIVRRLTALIQSSVFPNIQGGDEVTIDGVPYTVWERMKTGDGAVSKLLLRL